MIELSLLKAFLKKEVLEGYKDCLNPKTLSKQSLLLLKDYEVYHALHPNVIEIPLHEFSTFFFNQRHTYLDDKSVDEYKEIFRLLEEQDTNQEVESLILSFKQQVLYEDLRRLIDTNKDLDEVESQIETFKLENQKEAIDEVFEDMDLSAALEYTDRSKGLQWRCKALRDYFQGGLIKGDFGIVAGYVGCGKSSFIASEISYMAQNSDGDDYFLWLSNEGNWKSLLPRLYCAALNATPFDLRAQNDKAVKYYKKAMKGDQNRVRILDIQGWNAKQIEKLVKKKPPKLLVIDLIDNIEGFDKYMNKESSWEKYGKLYQWCREISTQYCPVLGVSQLNGEGEDNMYPKMSQLRGSRVEKQAACTFLLTIGSLIGDNSNRFLSMPKSKINEIGDWKANVKFDALRSRYV